MKFLYAFILMALVSYSGATYSQDVFLLLPKKSTYSVVMANQGGVVDVFAVGGVAAYGASANSIAILSYRVAAGGYILDVVDMSKRRVSSSWPINAEPVMQLSGPSASIVLSDAFAYFLTIRRDEGGTSFEFNQLSLADGSLRTRPLTEKFANPRLVDFEGTPLLYSWNGFGVVKFDPATQSFDELISRVDIADTISKEELGQRSGKIGSSAFADHVAVSGAGVFRLSKFGDLHQVLTSDLIPVDADRSIPLGSAENIQKLFEATFNDGPAIGVLRKVNGRLQLIYVDPVSLSVVWERGLPDGIVVQSVLGSAQNEVFYVDQTPASIKKQSKDAEITVSRLTTPQVFNARILAVSGIR